MKYIDLGKVNGKYFFNASCGSGMVVDDDATIEDSKLDVCSL